MSLATIGMSGMGVTGIGTAGSLLVSLVLASSPCTAQHDQEPVPEAEPEQASTVLPDSYILDHTVKDIEGHEVDLRQYEGRVVMIVNVASKCGLTPQYEQLESMYDELRDEGFVVLAFPANNFAKQEPGTNRQIAEFCEATYAVEFPLMAKVSVLGEDRNEVYQDLVGQPDPIGGDPKWNFTKFLLNRRGEVVARFEPRTRPDAKEVRAKILELLADKELRDGVEPWSPPKEDSEKIGTP